MRAAVALDPGAGCALLCALALLFVHAAWHKWRALAQFREQLDAYRLLPAALLGAFVVAVPLAETAVPLLLLPAVTRPWAAAAGALLLLAYAAAMTINLARGRRDLDCGCAGPGERRPIAPWMVWRNLLLAALLLAGARPWSARALQGTDLVTIAGGALVLIVLYAALDRLLGQIMPRTAALRGVR